jgi:hypothetical protein
MTIPDPSEIQRYTEEVLRRPEFHAAAARRPDAFPWLARFIAWLATRRLPIFGGIGIGELFAIGIGIAVLATLVVHLARLVRSGTLRGAPRTRTASETPAAVPAMAATPREAVRSADEALAAGDARGAVQALLHACLLFLAGLGAIALERWKTAAAYVKECPPSLAPFALFRDLAAAHNDIVYAHRVVAPQRLAAMRDALERHLGPP